MLDKPFDEWTTYPAHVGIDFPYRQGRVVRASGSGIVRWSGWAKNKSSGDRATPGKGAGNAKVVVYDNGVEARYCHLMNLEGARSGERVKYGDIVGYVGTTGKSTGPHLHMEVWINGQIQTNNNFWRYVNRNAYVGDGYGNYTAPTLSGGTSRPLPTPAAKKEDTMTHAVMLNKAHFYAIGEEFISHHATIPQYEVTRNVNSIVDETHSLSTAQFHDLLDGMGIPRGVVDVKTGAVLNPQSGKYEGNGVWSRRREAIAKLDELLARDKSEPATLKK